MQIIDFLYSTMMYLSNLNVFFCCSWEYGENHLLFNIVPPVSDISELNTDRAIIAGADFDAWNFRTGFDFPISFLGYRRDISNPINMNNDR